MLPFLKAARYITRNRSISTVDHVCDPMAHDGVKPATPPVPQYVAPHSSFVFQEGPDRMMRSSHRQTDPGHIRDQLKNGSMVTMRPLTQRDEREWDAFLERLPHAHVGALGFPCNMSGGGTVEETFTKERLISYNKTVHSLDPFSRSATYGAFLHDGTLVGVTSLLRDPFNSDTLETVAVSSSIVVDPTYENTGVATRLIEFQLAHAHAAGCDEYCSYTRNPEVRRAILSAGNRFGMPVSEHVSDNLCISDCTSVDLLHQLPGRAPVRQPVKPLSSPSTAHTER